jgi:hypothetical protein
MPITLSVDAADLLRYRFAVSPVWEVQAAVRTLLYPERFAAGLPWLRSMAQHRAEIRAGVLPLLMPTRGYTPDFLSPPPVTPTASIDEELARVRATPLDRVAAELRRAAVQAGDHPAIRSLADDPARAREELAGTLHRWWHRLLAADWTRIRETLNADITYRAGRLTRGGIELLITDLHGDVRWDGGRIVVDGKTDHRDLNGLGLLLVPSVFSWPTVSVITDRPWQPTLIYPARGAGTLWAQPIPSPPRDIAALLGRTRATILYALREPVCTTTLATRLALSAGTVSAHLSTLRRAGLATTHRVGHQVRYTLTPLGHQLAATR